MKRILSVFACVLIIASLIPFSVSAADTAEFNVSVIAQTDNSVTVTFDFVSGTGFAALDVSIKFNTVKLTLNKAIKGTGYKTFTSALEDAGGMCICSINDQSNPINVSMANTKPFEIQNGDGAVVELQFSKIPGTKLSEEDITVEITNCQTTSFADIATSVTTDLEIPQVQDGNVTAYAQKTSRDNKNSDDKNKNGSEIGDKAENNSEAQDSQQGAKDASSKDAKTDSSNKKTVIIVAAVIVAVAGAAALAIVFSKNAKKPENKY